MPASRARPMLLLVTGLAWAAAAAVLAAALLRPWPSHGAAAAIATAVAALAPALAIILLAATALRRDADHDLAELEARTAAAAAAGTAVREGLLDLDATLASVQSRLEALREATAREVPPLSAASRLLGEAAAGLGQAGTSATAATREVGDALAAAQHQAEAIAAVMLASGEGATRQLTTIDTMVTTVSRRREGAEAAMATAAAEADRVAALFDRQAAAIDGARAGLEAAGGPVAGSVARQVAAIEAATAAMTERLADGDARTAAMIATIERSFAVLDKRLAHAAAMGAATLDALHGRMEAVRGLADTLHPPLEAANTALVTAAASVARLQPATAAANELVRTLREAEQPATALHDRVDAAAATLAAIETAAHGSALAATQQLIDLLGRVRDTGNAAAGHVREALAATIAEAEAELAQVGSRLALSGFADPIRHEIAGLEGATAMAADAAQATADRMAARLLGLTAVVAKIERRLSEAEG